MKARLLSLVIVATLCWGVSARAQGSDSEKLNVNGKWKGTRTSTGQIGINADRTHSISFDLTQSGNAISGSYKCYAGKKATVDCNNPVGKVTEGSIDGTELKVNVQALPNGLNCSFKGKVENSTIQGTFACYAGGTLASNGLWKVHRY